MDLLDLAKNFGIPALGALAGFLGSASHYKHRLEQVEKDFAEFKKDHKEKHETDQKDIKEKLEGVRKALDTTLGGVRDELLVKFKDLETEVTSIDKAFTQFERASGHDFAKDAELAHFIEEQNKQWQVVHRLLGQIEGLMKNPKRWSSRPPPMPSTSK